jgi:hypothetical protein
VRKRGPFYLREAIMSVVTDLLLAAKDRIGTFGYIGGEPVRITVEMHPQRLIREARGL